jgi:hypothetical protein
LPWKNEFLERAALIADIQDDDQIIRKDGGSRRDEIVKTPMIMATRKPFLRFWTQLQP